MTRYPFRSLLVAAALGLASTAAQATTPPALYTASQAASGQTLFATNCSMCHGAALQGISGPALIGQSFASAANNYTVAAIFDELSQQMPAGNPGSLSKSDYTDIMAFILSKNGYPAGSTALTYDGAQSSTVKLVSQVK
ncbi:c-type cytochrome [Acidiphilium sp.]|uniref:c-type cytochrome n=1 Tax=Acidiphilium sp. TaxID=527 RepID=UPI003D067D47